MFKHPTKTGFRGPISGTLLCLTLAPLLAPADPPAADTGGTDKTVFTESDSVLRQTTVTDYSVFGIGYMSDDQLLVDLESSPLRGFSTMTSAVAYSTDSEVHGGSGSDELKAVALNRTRVRQKVVDWVKARSPAAGAVTHLLVAKPDTGWHLAIDPGDEVTLEWQVTF